MKGYFITFEGGEGSGKSTQLSLLKDYLDKSGRRYIYTREPGGTEIAEEIREILLSMHGEKMCDECEALLFAAARVQHIKNRILPAINDGNIVVCDRYVDSSMAYQGYARGLGEDLIEKVNFYAYKNCMPDVTFFLDVPPAAAFKRKGGADESDRVEMSGDKFHEKVYKAFSALCNKYPSRFIRIDAKQDARHVHNDIINTLKSKGIIE